MKNTKEELYTTIFLYVAITLALIASVFSLSNSFYQKNFSFVKDPVYQSPVLQPGDNSWQIKSVDMEKDGRSNPALSRDEITKQVKIYKEMGANYIAISPLYDDYKTVNLWSEIIHSEGLLVWYKLSWLDWSGSMTTESYLEKTYQFILDNKMVFREGDSFSFATSPETEGVGMGLKFLTWKEYNKFLIEGLFMSQYAFRTIEMEGKVHTNWITVRSETAKDRLSPEFVEKAGIVTAEYFGEQSHTRGVKEDSKKLVDAAEKEIDELHAKWDKPILLEWGYQINQQVTEQEQSEVVKEFMDRISTKTYLLGINYFTGSLGTSALIKPLEGGNLSPNRSADVIRNYFVIGQ